jgi:MFS family permease
MAQALAPGHVEHVHKRQWRPYVVFMVLIMGLGSLTEGYAAAVIGPTLAQPTFIAYFDLASRSNATGIISSMNGVFFAGAAILVLIIPYFADKFGRKAAISISAGVIIVTSALLAGSTNVGEFITWRFFQGAGTWMMLSAVPIWMTEVAPPAIRGTLVDIHGACLLFGYAFCDWVGYGFYGEPNRPLEPCISESIPCLACRKSLFYLRHVSASSGIAEMESCHMGVRCCFSPSASLSILRCQGTC